MKTIRLRFRSLAHRLGLLGPALCALFAAGCASVNVPEPVGEKPHALNPADWEGTWVIGHDLAKVTVTDAANGWLKTTGIKERDGQATLETTAIQVRESGGWLFANVRDDGAKTERYTWGRIKIEDAQVVVWEPDLEKFRALVRQGRLRGKLDGDNVNLEPLSADDLKALTSGALGVPLAWDSPFVIRRVAR